jgi:arginyl-tRNA synthetase
MMPFANIIIEEIKKSLGSVGVKADVVNLGNEIVVTIPKDEIVENIRKGFPEQYQNMVVVEAGDIKIRIRIM